MFNKSELEQAIEFMRQMGYNKDADILNRLSKESFMITSDAQWKNLVQEIAGDSTYSKTKVLLAAGYLWDSANWERLNETVHGKFLREVHNSLPYPSLREIYRKEVLGSKE